jgi:prepilin-type N-terminal cleavage/methylation domain-containing protein/prepilin-type processing-associated H-X9-DG protein
MPKFRLRVQWWSRRAFTLIELLVVIAIIAILIGLLVPAVQKVRAAAQRAQCQNHLKQLALAVHHYADNNQGLLPPGGVIGSDGDWEKNQGTWLVYTLPYMEQAGLYSKIERFAQDPNNGPVGTIRERPNAVGGRKKGDPAQGGEWGSLVHKPAGYFTVAANRVRLPYARCPSDPHDPDAFGSNYVGSLGPQCAIGPCGYDPFQSICNGNGFNGIPWPEFKVSNDHGNDWSGSGIRGLFNRLGAKLKFPSAVVDGTSNTIMIGEVAIDTHDHLIGNEWWNYNSGLSHATTLPGINYLTADRYGSENWCSPADRYRGNWNVSWGFNSMHPDGANFAFADGSVQFLAERIDRRVYNRLGGRADGAQVSVP